MSASITKLYFSLSWYSAYSTWTWASILVNKRSRRWSVKNFWRRNSDQNMKQHFQVTRCTKEDGLTWAVVATRWQLATKLGWKSTRDSAFTWTTPSKFNRSLRPCSSAVFSCQSQLPSGAASTFSADSVTCAHTCKHQRKGNCLCQLLCSLNSWCPLLPWAAAFTFMHQRPIVKLSS